MNNEKATAWSSGLQATVNTVFTNWHFMRWLRLGLGLYLLWQLTARPDIFTGLVAAFFLFQALTSRVAAAPVAASSPKNAKPPASLKT